MVSSFHLTGSDGYTDAPKAAEQGDAEAQASLGVSYLAGREVPKDWVKARDLLSKAAEQGDVLSEANFAFMLEHGMGGAVDRTEAIKWYQKAAAAGNRDSKAGLARLSPQTQSTQ